MLEKYIEFTLTEPNLDMVAEFPSPAIKNLPEWYKKMPSYSNNKKTIKDSGINATVKKCMPVLDSMSNGYIIKTCTDVNFSENEVTWSVKDSGFAAVTGHAPEQIPDYPLIPYYKKEVFKWTNPWHIKTPKGYSCMFVTPIGHDLPFKLIEGVVDTDTFPLTINFPFFLENNFKGVIPYNTPMVQVIPFKRDEFKSKRGVFNKDKYQSLKNLHDRTFVNKYKINWRKERQFK
jgi:hypothetical protein